MAVNNLNTPGVGIQPSIVDAKGDLLVGTAADAISRLGVTGTTGSVLTADAGETTGLKWAAAGSVGGLVHIDTASGSNVAAISIDNCFSADYDYYRVIFNFEGLSNSSASLRLRASGTDSTGTNYNQQILNVLDTTITATRQTGGTAWTSVANASAVNIKVSSIYEIHNPFLAQETMAYSIPPYYPSGNPSLRIVTQYHTATTSYDGLTVFISAGGNLTGSVSVYGFRN